MKTADGKSRSPQTLDYATDDTPLPVKKIGPSGTSLWIGMYCILGMAMIAAIVVADWWGRAWLVIAFVASGYGIYRLEKRQQRTWRGVCRSCGYDIYDDDNWCPRCKIDISEWMRK